MKRALVLLFVAAALAALGWSLWRTQPIRPTQTPATPSAASAGIELAAEDVVLAQRRLLIQGVAVSGTLKSVATALIKARVAGELRDLSVREGDVVQAGQLIARIDPSEYEARWRQARQQAQAAKAQIDIAQRQYDNNKALVDQGFISRSALDTSLSNLEAARASHEAALAAQDVAGKALDDTQLRSPLDGRVSQRLAQNGERMAVDARVLEVVDPRRLELEATVSAAESAALRPGQTATLMVEGVARPLQAQVARINPVVQSGSRSVLVYLSLPAVDGLRQGLFAQGSIATAQGSVLAVPLSTLRTDKPQPYLQLLTETGGQWRVAHRAVQPGVRGREASALADPGAPVWVAVEGVREGERVLQGSVGALRDGTAVQPLPARP